MQDGEPVAQGAGGDQAVDRGSDREARGAGAAVEADGFLELLLMRLFRGRLLARLVDAHAISPELVAKLLAWKHPGFSAHVGEPIEPENKQHLEDTAAYLVRNPLLCGRPHSSGSADLAIMRSIACADAGFARSYSEMRAVVDTRWSA